DRAQFDIRPPRGGRRAGGALPPEGQAPRRATARLADPV
ncbi:MAG: hypothetical protein AVDCRST_MAG88-1928, partial [uncultured Thermomicrobiales bacterium]